MVQSNSQETQKDKYPHIESVEFSVKFAGGESIVFTVADRGLISGLWKEMRSWLRTRPDGLHDTPTVARIRPRPVTIRQQPENIRFDAQPRTVQSHLRKEGAALPGRRGRKQQQVSGTGPRGDRKEDGTSSENAHPSAQIADVRSWARENGYDIGDRGRIPRRVAIAYANVLKDS